MTIERRRMALLWVLIVAAAMLLEGYALGARNGGTLSALVRDQVHHATGRFFYYPLWAWLSWHWFLASKHQTPTWRDLVAIGIGLVTAGIVTLVGR